MAGMLGSIGCGKHSCINQFVHAEMALGKSDCRLAYIRRLSVSGDLSLVPANCSTPAAAQWTSRAPSAQAASESAQLRFEPP